MNIVQFGMDQNRFRLLIIIGMPTGGNYVVPARIIVMLIDITSRKHMSINKAALCVSTTRQLLAKRHRIGWIGVSGPQ
jgi:hypothetical protein